MNWILFGFKGVGKTTFGRKLAKSLNRTFIDTDQIIEEASGLSPRDFTLQNGVEAFRGEESRVIENLWGDRLIISVGGGSVLRPKNVEKLLELGHMIHLTCPVMTLKQRLFKPPYPTFLDPNDLERSFEKIYEQRIQIYEKIASFALLNI